LLARFDSLERSLHGRASSCRRRRRLSRRLRRARARSTSRVEEWHRGRTKRTSRWRTF